MDKTIKLLEIATCLDVKMYKVFEWIRNGELNAINISNTARPQYRVEVAEFEAFKLRVAAAQGDRLQPRTVAQTPSPSSVRLEMKRTLTPPEIAKYFRVSNDKVLAWIRSGELRATNVSNCARPLYRVEESDFEAFKLRRSSTSAVPTPRGQRWYPPATLPPQIANRERNS